MARTSPHQIINAEGRIVRSHLILFAKPLEVVTRCAALISTWAGRFLQALDVKNANRSTGPSDHLQGVSHDPIGEKGKVSRDQHVVNVRHEKTAMSCRVKELRRISRAGELKITIGETYFFPLPVYTRELLTTWGTPRLPDHYDAST